MPFDTHLLDEALAQRSVRLEEERQELYHKTVGALEQFHMAYAIRYAYIFGSVTRPHRFHEHSDIDIAIKTERPELLPEAIGRFSSFLQRDVDLINLDTAPFADRIQREGIQWKAQNFSSCGRT